MRDGQPDLLWHFSTGDRADGGRHRIYSDAGDLVVELQSLKGNVGLCCPKYFVRTRYRWAGNGFQQIKVETLPIGKP
jgi:hypothetical protein